MIESVGLSVVGVQPYVHRQYRQAFFEKEGTLNGVYAKELPLDMALLNEVLEGRIVLEGDTSLGKYEEASKIAGMVKAEEKALSMVNVLAKAEELKKQRIYTHSSGSASMSFR